MEYNHGLARKKFEDNWKRLRKKYEGLGMDEDAITELYIFDLSVFNSERRYAEHTQELKSSGCGEGDNGDDSKSVLLKKFAELLSISDDESICHSRYWWIEEISDEQLLARLRILSEEEIELLTLYVLDGYTQAEIAARYRISQKNICKKITRIKSFLSGGV